MKNLANQFFTDCNEDNRQPNTKNLLAWLCFACPAEHRAEVESQILSDPRWLQPIDRYLLRDIPAGLWGAAKRKAIDEGMSLRELILAALRQYLNL